MNTDHNAIAASLDAAQVAELAQLNDDAFLDYARRLAGVVPTASFPSSNLSTPSIVDPPLSVSFVDASEPASPVYLECTIGAHHCLLPLAALVEIVPTPEHLTFLPAMPLWMPGLTAWRGEPVAVIDLESYLKDTSAGSTDSRDEADGSAATTRGRMLLMLHHRPATFALFVSGIGAVATIPAAQLTPISPAHETIAWLAPSRLDLLAGISESRVALDVPRLLNALTRQIGLATTHG